MAVQPCFFDLSDRYEALSAAGDPLERLSAVVDFELFRGPLVAALRRGLPIPMKPPLVSEMIAPLCSEMMSPPGDRAVLATSVVVSFASAVKSLEGIWRGACCRRPGRGGGRCEQAGRGWRRHRWDRRSLRATPQPAVGW